MNEAADAMNEALVGSVVRDVTCIVEPLTTLRGVADAMVETGEALALVVDGLSVSGVVSEGDIVRALHDGADLDEVWAADVMTADLLVVDVSSTVSEAMKTMVDERVRHLIVHRGDSPGLVSLAEVVSSVLDSG
jgi:CBS domain-containing protein